MKARKEELEAELRMVNAQLEEQKLTIPTICPTLRRKMKQCWELEKEFDAFIGIVRVHEKKRAKIMDENHRLKTKLRDFVIEAKALLAKWK